MTTGTIGSAAARLRDRVTPELIDAFRRDRAD